LTAIATDTERILITGGAGFIGANLVRYLLKRGGIALRVLDNLSTGQKAYLEQIIAEAGHPAQDRMEFLEGDICDPELVAQAVQGVNAVVHLAARTSVVDSLENPQADFQTNAVGTLNLLEACRKRGIERFVYASSNAVLGEQEPPIDETKVPQPLSPYGAAKLAGEALCSAYAHSFGMRAISLRFANVYGPFSAHKSSVIATFLRRAREGKPLIIYGDGSQTRDFIHAIDICRAIECALQYEPEGPQAPLVFQIATGRETSILELAHMVRDLATRSGLKPPEFVFRDPRPGEIRRNYANITRAAKYLGFQPRIELADGLRGLWEQEVTKVAL